MTRWTRFKIPGINRQVLLYLLHCAIYHVGLFGITDVLLNFYLVSLGYSAETIGAVVSVTRLGSFVTGIPIGLIANHIGVKRLTFLGILGVALSYVLLLTAVTPLGLMVARFTLGATYGAAYIAWSPLMIGLVRREEQTHVFSHFNVVTMASTSLGALIGGHLPTLIAQTFQLPGPNPAQSSTAYGTGLAVSGVLIALSLIPLLWLKEQRVEQSIPVKPGGAPIPVNPSIPWRELMRLSLPFLFFGITAGWTFPYYNLFFRNTFMIDDQTVGSILSVGWLGMAVITIGNPWLERRLGRVNALGMTLTVGALAFIVLGTASSLAVGAVAFWVAVSLRNTMTPLFQPVLMETLPKSQHNMVSSLTTVIWSLGWFGATVSGGFVAKQFGYGLLMILVAIGVLATGISIVLIFRHRRPYHEVSEAHNSAAQVAVPEAGEAK